MIENGLDKEFLLKLADLCEEYGATFGYTIDDDGIHISVDGGREVFVGYLFDAPKELRDAAGHNDRNHRPPAGGPVE